MTGRYDRPRLSAAARLSSARQRAATEAPKGPWQWPWRRRRNRRIMGCLLWLLTLLLVLLVLSILFGGFQRGTKVGAGTAIRCGLIWWRPWARPASLSPPGPGRAG